MESSTESSGADAAVPPCDRPEDVGSEAPSSPCSAQSDGWSETSDVPCTDKVEPEGQPDEDPSPQDLNSCAEPTECEERVRHEVDIPIAPLSKSLEEETSMDESINVPSITTHEHSDFSTILHALQDECDRSYQQVRSLTTRLRGMPEDMQLFLEGHLNALEKQRLRLNVHASALAQIRVEATNDGDSDTFVESKSPKRGRGRPPKSFVPPPCPPKRPKVQTSGQVAVATSSPLRWDPSRVGINATVSSRGYRLKTTRSAWNVAMGNAKVSSFCVKVGLPKSKARNAIAIGFIKEPKFWEVPHGGESVFVFNYSGWYLNVRKGSLCSLQGHDDSPFGQPFKDGDTLMALLDHTSKTLSFVHNGSHLGVAYSNVDDAELFPAVISYDARVQLTFLE